MRVSIGLVLISTIAVFNCCSPMPNLTKDEVYNILNEIIADDSLRLNTICSQIDFLTVSDEYGFTTQDTKFIEHQKEIFKNFKFEPKRLRSFSRRKQSFDFIYIDTTCSKGILNRLSFPLISIDRQRVVIENTQDCHCMLGGQGGKDLYIKHNGRWKREQSFDRWISQNTGVKLNRQIAMSEITGSTGPFNH